MNAMDLKMFVGTEKMCMFHEPAGFWPNIFVHVFLGHSKSHCHVTSRGPTGSSSAIKVKWRYFNFAANNSPSL